MARNIPIDALIKIAETKGLEPINLVRVQWCMNGDYYYYADRELEWLPFVQGKLLSLNGLEAVIDVSNTGSSTSVSMEFDDTDGTIKEIFNWNDIHGRFVVILQWFDGLPFNSAFSIFGGAIASPIEWSEGGRTLKFDVMTRIEDVQAGFSIEDGQFLNIPRLLLGKAWPLIFGTVLDIPTVQMDEIPTGTLRVDIGIPDENVGRQAEYHNGQGNCMIGKGICLSMRGAELQFQGFAQAGSTKQAIELENRGRQLQNQGHKLQLQGQAQLLQGNRLNNIKIDQKKYDLKTIPIINGHLFLQGQHIAININGALYAGHFNGDNFQVTARQAPEEAVPKEPVAGTIAADTAIATRLQQQLQQIIDRQVAQLNYAASVDLYPMLNPDGSGTSNWSDWTSENYWACNPPYFICMAPGDTNGSGVGTHQLKDFWHAEAGATVNVGNNYPIRYVLSITPGTVVRWLSSHKTINNLKVLTPIPPNYYSLSWLDLGGVVALIATFHQPMSTLKTVNNPVDWDDDIYATLTSPIGPNVVDEMIYIIQRWTVYGIDFDSFNYVRSKIDLYPGNFALLEKKNVIDLLKDMAFQSRCAIWVADGKWHLRYIPEQGTPVDSINENDIESTSLVITTTATEDLTTRYIATWRQSYATDDRNKLILQYNIPKYGVHEETYDFYIYNTEELVYKSAVFWLIRKANVWKILKFKTFLTKLKIETLDNVWMNLVLNFASIGVVVGTVNKATFNSADFDIDMEIWLPVRLGEMYQYEFAYPAGISVQAVWPTQKDIAGNFTQSSYAPSQAQGSLGGSNPSMPTKGSAGTGTQSHPSDSHDQQNHPPLITATIDSKAPSYQPSTNPPGTSSGATAPRFDYTHRAAPAPDPVVADTSKAVPRSAPGCITTKINNNMYNCMMYWQGTNKPGQEQPVNILDISPDETIPENTWGIVHYQPEEDEQKKIIHKYYFQPPIWNISRETQFGGGDDEGTGDTSPVSFNDETPNDNVDTNFPEDDDTDYAVNPDGDGSEGNESLSEY